MHPVDEMRDLHDSLQAFELRTLKRLAPWLGNPISRRVICHGLYWSIDGLMWLLCFFVIMKFLWRYRLAEMLVILGGVGTVIFSLGLGDVAHGHADHLQELVYLSSGQFEASELLSGLTPSPS